MRMVLSDKLDGTPPRITFVCKHTLPVDGARGYLSTTSGNVTDDVIRQYLELHSKREPTDISR